MDPATIAAVGKAFLPFLTSSRPPSQAQVDAALAQQRADERNKWLLGGALAGGALLLYLVASRR